MKLNDEVTIDISTNMEDVISHLKSRNVGFIAMPLTEQLMIKENRSTPDLDLQQKDGGSIRKFNRKWYDIYPWLTGSGSLNRMFCLVCTIYGGEPSWGDAGIDVIKNFTNKAEKHQSSKRHIRNMELFLMIGKVRRVRDKERLGAEQAKQNEIEESQRRAIMSQIMDAIFFLILKKKVHRGPQEAVRISLEELIMRRYLYNTTTFREIYGNMHNELLASMEFVLLEDIKKEISEAEFCSIQTDEVPNKDAQYSVIIRYAHRGYIKERFVGFFEIQQTFDLAQIINTIIGDARKLVCHSCDGAVQMKSIRQGLKSIMPNLLFVHNYLHKLNTLLLQGLQNVGECKEFARQVAFICEFFSVPRRAAILKELGVVLPYCSETLWKFHSKSVSTIIKNYSKISQAINSFILDEQSDDLETVNSAWCVHKILQDNVFVLFSCLFNKIFVYADHLANVVQRKINAYVETCIQDIQQTIRNISNFKTDIIIRHCADEAKTHLKIKQIPPEILFNFKRIAFLIIESVVEQIEDRYSDTKFFKFVEILDGTRFINYKNKFPKVVLQEFGETFPDLFDMSRLENELTMIYGDPFKRYSPLQLFSYLYDNDLIELYRETYKMLRFYLTFPLTATETHKISNTLTKVRNYLNHYEEGQESNSAILYVEKYSNGSSDYTMFKERVIEHFDESKQKNI